MTIIKRHEIIDWQLNRKFSLLPTTGGKGHPAGDSNIVRLFLNAVV